MKLLIVLLWCLTSTTTTGSVLEASEVENEWKAWKDFHGKTYVSESEEATRKAIWRENHKVTTTSLIPRGDLV